MRKSIFAIIVLIVSGVFTSCTDLEGKVVPEKVKQELQSTTGNQNNGDTGGNEQDPDEEDPIEEDKG
ncbi:hypothetical protein F7018_08570 [Tenacibaculum aiptasiae]|uniref:Uncharacterized protein n=1 Tax=Tenacibaculum aiptasiae TaxID=426481 RepID=A0A7J5AM25_9FLAO|nr:hypothetical protein [Tenacibaculum aiptasiae]KAB1158661.1 hypothetical protein F7018_08570 [Tenacibaculum aiptasiae]